MAGACVFFRERGRGEVFGCVLGRENRAWRVLMVRARFMTFAPEWLSGNANLDTSNFMFL